MSVLFAALKLIETAMELTGAVTTGVAGQANLVILASADRTHRELYLVRRCRQSHV
jgi:hypothetical protein